TKVQGHWEWNSSWLSRRESLGSILAEVSTASSKQLCRRRLAIGDVAVGSPRRAYSKPRTIASFLTTSRNGCATGGRPCVRCFPRYTRPFGDALLQAAKTTLLFLSALFPIVNPLGGSPIFLTLTRDYSRESRMLLAQRISLNSFILLIASFFIGTHILA